MGQEIQKATKVSNPSQTSEIGRFQMAVFYAGNTMSKMMATATDTYNGKNGCACGCGGSYASPDSAAGKKRIAKIMKADEDKVIFTVFSGDGDEGCVEVENEDGTRVTRVYVKVGTN
jgi:hypothetical protein